MFAQVNQRMDEGMNGGDAFDHLLRLLASHFHWEDRGGALSELNAFHVPNGTTFGDFLRQYRTAVRVPAPSPEEHTNLLSTYGLSLIHI